LRNKYYSADVHFAAHTVTGLGAHAVRNVPAVLFVWAKGEVGAVSFHACWCGALGMRSDLTA
jgi:hypothetical protein